MRRTTYFRALPLMVAAMASSALAGPVVLTFIGQQNVATGTTYTDPTQTNPLLATTTIGGLSGLERTGANQYVAISDSRNAPGEGPAVRVYSLSLNLTATNFSGVTFTGTRAFTQPDGSLFPAFNVDPESIRLNRTGTGYLWTSEGDASGTAGRPVQNPFVREATLSGAYVREFALPSYYAADPASTTSGIRNNLAFEGLTRSTDGTRVIAAMEGALKQDGPAATLANGSLTRWLEYDATTGAATREFVYRTDPVTNLPNPAGGFTVAGLTELLAISPTEFLVVERSFSAGGPGNGHSAKIYLADIGLATNVLGRDTLQGQVFTEIQKTLVLDLATLGIQIDNIEGITFGDTLPNGARSLILVADNNFAGTQATQFLAFRIDVPEPATAALLAAGLGSITLLRRRKKLR